MLEDIRQQGSPSIRVSLQPASSELRIGSFLDFTVQTDSAGYLYVLHVGTDGKLFNLLFPNEHDDENRISPGTHPFPRASWRIRALGNPPGTGYLMAIVSQRPRDFLQESQVEGGFRSAPVNAALARSLAVEAASGNSAAPGRFGSSAVVAIREIP